MDRTNALRAENGIAALATDDLLMQAAQVRAEATLPYALRIDRVLVLHRALKSCGQTLQFL
ncbi:MAG: hypothetical protein RR475_12540 [Clostridia bacterium]